MKIKKPFRIIFTYLFLSIVGFLVLRIFLGNYLQKLVDSSDSAAIAILVSSVYALFAIDLYLLTLFFIALGGYFISKFKKRQEFIVAFKFLSWIHLVLWISFSVYWIID